MAAAYAAADCACADLVIFGESPIPSTPSELGTECELLAYSVTLFDGAELRLELGANASVHDAYTAVAEARGLPWYRLKLVARGHEKPLTRSSERLEAATGGVRDLFLVVASGVTLAEGTMPTCLEDCTFEHHPERCLGGTGGQELELFAGKRFTTPKYLGTCAGVMFRQVPGEPTAEAVPLWGRVMIRVVLHARSWALGVGVGTRELNTNEDPEYQECFFGLYHAGASTNVCAGGRRVLSNGSAWDDEQRLAVLVDVERHTMQCYCGLQKFGPLVSCLPQDDLWPAIVSFEAFDSVSLSIESTQGEAIEEA